MAQSDTVFAGSIPELYDRYLGPLIFEPYAPDLAARVASGPARARSRNRGRHRRPDPRAGGVAARRGRDRRDRSQPADARFRGGAPGVERGRLAAGRRAGAAVPGRLVRCRGLPVRRDVLPRQGRGLPRGAARAAAGRPVCVQRLGPDRGERVRGCRDASRRGAVPGRPAAFPRAHAARLSRRRRESAPSLRRPGSRASTIETVAQRSRAPRRAIRRSASARARRCATRSRRATRRRSARRRTRRRARSRRASVPARSTARYRRS